VQQS